jgi:hypothetical protein
MTLSAGRGIVESKRSDLANGGELGVGPALSWLLRCADAGAGAGAALRPALARRGQVPVRGMCLAGRMRIRWGRPPGISRASLPPRAS